MNNITVDFLTQIDNFTKIPIPSEVLARSKKSLLDYLAVTCAGAEFHKNKLNRYYCFAEPEDGKYKVIGTSKRVSLKEAVFLNGLNSHALDFDDGTNSGIIHLGSPIFSLLIPLAERYEISIDKMLRAAIVGYETSYTIAVSIQPRHKVMGYHATGTCGILGATLAASYMLGFTETERFHAFATACVSATGMLKALDDGSELKPYNVAKTALLSLISLQIAKAGFKGGSDPLGGRGFIKMMTGENNIELKPPMLNGTYAIMKSYTKPYASCRYTHPAIEAAIQLRNKVDLNDIECVNIKTYDLAVLGHDHTVIVGSSSAKMSIPYATAVGLIYGKAGLQEFSEETVKKEEVIKMTKKIHVEADEELSRMFPKIQAAFVSIKTIKGEYTKKIVFPKGEPENPMNNEEFKERFDELMKYAGINGDMAYNMVYARNAFVKELIETI